MTRIIFYDTADLDKQQLAGFLQSADHDVQYVTDKISLDNCSENAEIISAFVSSTVTREMIERMPKLRLIACRSTGFNNIDLAAAQERNITVVNVPTYGEATVAEYAFALLLSLTRKLPSVLAHGGGSQRSEDFVGHDLEGKTFGVIGTGHIGQKALKIARGFSMTTLAHDAFPKNDLQAELNFVYVSLEELLVRSDIVSLHVPYMPATHHLMNADRLQRMKKGSLLINTARGELIDTKALIEVLDSGHLGGAALDVVEGEALLNYHEEIALLRSSTLPESVLRHSIEISVLKNMPNVIVSPHNAFNTVEAIARINQTTAQNIMDFLRGDIHNRVASPPVRRGKLVVVRHAESEWNATGTWTGTTDVHLSEKGFIDSTQIGRALKKLEIPIDVAYCSEQIRTRETLEGIMGAAQQFATKVLRDKALNERDYGEYTGKNKWEIKKEIGAEAFEGVRRGWDVPIRGGETLKSVYDRVTPFYQKAILPLLEEGKNVLLVAHGNSIRALMKYIESISDENIGNLEMLFDEMLVYEVTSDGRVAKKDRVSVDISPSNG